MAEDQTQERKAAPEEERFAREQLQEEAFPRFGVAPHVVAGALSGQRGKTFTASQAEKAIKDFQKRVVSQPPDEED